MPEPIALNSVLRDRVAKAYEERFGRPPQILLRSPGRINLIGEHTDYNDGLVMPSAVGQGIYFAMGRAASRQTHRWEALDKSDYYEASPDDAYGLLNDWQDFIYGAWEAHARHSGQRKVFDCVFSADLPIGSGMSSSSALTCGVLYGLNSLDDTGLKRYDMAEMAHDVERNYIGLRGGIMDQYASLLSEPGHFLSLDCRSKLYRQLPFNGRDAYIFLLHSMTRRELTTSGYNDRSNECAEALSILNRESGIESLRDVNYQLLDKQAHLLTETLENRIRYTISENARVRDIENALQDNNWALAGQLLYEGHAGLSDLFEVSTPQLDFLVEYTRAYDWIYGARMMGGGFGGCTINLASRRPDDEFMASLAQEYHGAFGVEPRLIDVELAGGTCILH